MSQSILTVKGVIQLSVPHKYDLPNIIDQEDQVIDVFKQILNLPKSSRYYVIYTLALNNLLNTPLSEINRMGRVLRLIDTVVTQSDGQFTVPEYGLEFKGKRSDLFRLLSFVSPEGVQSHDSFEKSFHLLPDKFLGGIDRINDPDKLKSKIINNIRDSFSISETTISSTFDLIDDLYFDRLLQYRLKASGKHLSFRVSYQMETCAGSLTTLHDGNFVLAISHKLTEASNPLDAFVSTLQHELVHLIVNLEIIRLGINPEDGNFDKELFRSHGRLFKDIALRFFGLTECRHSYFREVSTEAKPTFNVGDRVYFELRKTRTFGEITKLNPKRAKVRITGATYNVPYECLHKA